MRNTFRLSLVVIMLFLFHHVALALKYFPYRYGQAFWAFMAGVYGDTIVYPLFLNTPK